MNSFYALAGLTGGLGGTLLALVMLYRGRRKANLLWTGFWLSFSFWGWGLGGIGWSNDPPTAIWLWRLAGTGAALLPVFFTQIVLLFLGRNRRWLDLSLYLLAAIMTGLGLAGEHFVGGVKPTANQLLMFEPGDWFWVFIVYYFGIIGISLYLLAGKFRDKLTPARSQAAYFLIGGLILFSAGALNFIPAYGIDLFDPALPNIVGYAGALVVAYALLKLRLKGWRLFFRDIAFYTLLALLLFFGYVCLTAVLNWVLGGVFNKTGLLIVVLAVAGSAWLMPRIISRLRSLTNKSLYAKEIKIEQALVELAKKLPTVLNLEQLIALLDRTIRDQLGIKIVHVWLRDGNHYYANQQLRVDGWREDHATTRWLRKKHDVLVTREIKQLARRTGDANEREQLKQVLAELKAIKIEAVIPLITHRRIFGLLLLGQKQGEAYSVEDVELLKMIAASAAVALENAKLYREQEMFGERLKIEVQKATQELAEANQKLRQLDQAKNEFIRLASHQLNTPLTSVQGFVSMILENDYGEISPKQRTILQAVFVSTRRLIELVKNLLDITKIEAGHFEMLVAEVDLVKVAKEAIDELNTQAANKKLALVLNVAATETRVMGDERRLKQAVINLIDNGIKFTKQGQIKINLQNAEDQIEIQVTDTGRGLAPGEIKKLFQKFSRLPDAPLIHTEGVGIGLYLVEQIAVEHHGNVDVESAGLGYGSTFIMTLPLAHSSKSLKATTVPRK